MLSRGLCRLLVAAAVLVLAVLVGPVLAGHAHVPGTGPVDRGCSKCTLAAAVLLVGQPPQVAASPGLVGTEPLPAETRAAAPLGLAGTSSRAPPPNPS